MSRSNHVQAITFDAGGTLIYPWPSVGDIYTQVAARHGLKAAPEVLNRNFAAAWQAKTNFNHTRSDWAKLVQASFAVPDPLREDIFSDIYDQFAQPEVWRLYDDVIPTLEKLRERDMRLAVISNWDERLRLLLPRLGLEDYFEVIVVSWEVGFGKPSPVIFEYALRKLGLPADAVLHVGDSQAEDVEGAKALGIDTVLISRAKESPDAIRSLTELLES